jgi:hypothetical protein
MKTDQRIIMRQLVDWRAAMIAGIISGLFAFFLHITLSAFLLDSPWVFLRITASLLLGKNVLPPPADFSWGFFLTAAGIHIVLGLIYASLIAVVIHQWGILISFLGGALIGLALYTINFYAFSMLFPWFYAFRSWAFLVVHVLFGAMAGSVYELLEVEKYVEIKQKVKR